MMEKDRPDLGSASREIQHLKRVSRIKHIILEKYLPSWATILGSQNSKLAYVDCFAGPGEYEYEGDVVEGSPVIAVQQAIKFVKDKRGRNLNVYLVDDNQKQLEQLKTKLEQLQPYPHNLEVAVQCADSRSF